MSDEPSPARPVELTGVLGTVLVASALQFALARVLLLAQGGVARVGAGVREAMDLGVAATGVAMLVLLYLRARTGRTAPLLRELPATLVVIPLVGTLAALPGFDVVIADVPAALHSLAPALGSTIAAGLLMATLVGAAMRSLSIRGG